VFDSQQGQEIFLFFTASILTLGLTHSPIQYGTGASFLGDKAGEARSLSSRIYRAIPPYYSIAWRLIKQSDKSNIINYMNTSTDIMELQEDYFLGIVSTGRSIAEFYCFTEYHKITDLS
jgi:hypothetical protein